VAGKDLRTTVSYKDQDNPTRAKRFSQEHRASYVSQNQRCWFEVDPEFGTGV
jgi:hypothetical protein